MRSLYYEPMLLAYSKNKRTKPAIPISLKGTECSPNTMVSLSILLVYVALAVALKYSAHMFSFLRHLWVEYHDVAISSSTVQCLEQRCECTQPVKSLDTYSRIDQVFHEICVFNCQHHCKRVFSMIMLCSGYPF